MKMNTCCFIGHRTINETDQLKTQLLQTIEHLIRDKQVDTFLFGSKSRFNDLCLELVTAVQPNHPHIRRIYVRAEFPVIDDDYKAYLLRSYEDTYYPDSMVNAGKAAYVERNYHMIEQSQFCVIYYDASNLPARRKSGTKIALDYARKQQKEVIQFPDET